MSVPSASAARTVVHDPFGVEREVVLLRLADGAGNIGSGEASPLDGYSPDDLDSAECALDDWAARWTAGEAEEAGRDHGGSPAAAAAGLQDVPSAGCAVDTALLDLEAHRLEVPLHAVLLGSFEPTHAVERIPVCALVTLPGVDRPGAPTAPTDVVAEVKQWVAEGFTDVKFKIGGDPGFAAQLGHLRAIRAEFPRLRMRLDANGCWTPDEARRRLSELKATIDPEFVEQPVGAADLLTFGNAPIPLAADESLRLPDAVRAVTRPGGCVVVVLKPMILGGLRACLRVADQAAANGARAVVTHTFGGPIAHAAACELALAVAAAAADRVGRPLAAGLAGHDELEQRAGPWIVPTKLTGHGVEASL